MGVPTKALKQAVKRNAGRFPEDFMFVVTLQELAEWRSQFVTSKADRMGLRRAPMAFTGQGVAMLSSVLYQRRLAEANEFPHVLSIPTGAGRSVEVSRLACEAGGPPRLKTASSCGRDCAIQPLY
jgi:hypothetical protein